MAITLLTIGPVHTLTVTNPDATQRVYAMPARKTTVFLTPGTVNVTVSNLVDESDGITFLASSVASQFTNSAAFLSVDAAADIRLTAD